MYKCEIVADSLSPQGNRLTTFLVTYPRIVHAEMLRHRMFSRNVASSRAIPFEKMVKDVEENPFIPIAWQKSHKGMQGTEYFNTHYSQTNDYNQDIHYGFWMDARDEAIRMATCLHDEGLTKQLCNRLLEPFMWHTTLISATEFSNFFELRCPQYEYYDMLTGNQQFFKSKKDWLQYHNNKPLPKAKHISKIPENDVEWLQINKSQAEIHIQALAEAMWDTMNESTPKKLKSGEWHLPFSDKINDGKLAQSISPNKALIYNNLTLEDLRLKVCVSRCARLSYMTFDGEIDYEKDIKLHDRLLESHHMSPFEHCARVMTDKEYANFSKTSLSNLDNRIIEVGWCNNFKGFIQYRYLVEND